MDNPNLVVIVPYRDRKEHLDIFVPYIKESLKKQNIPNELLVVEQSSGRFFNRGLLLNIGFSYCYNKSSYVCFHDIDMIGEPFDYSYSDTITHLASKQKDRNYEEWYNGYLGGVVLFPTEVFKNINGFSNNYWGWGCEDDDLRIRCELNQLLINRRPCKYYQLFHKKSGWDNNCRDKTYIENNKRLKRFLALSQQEKTNAVSNDGLNTVYQHCNINNILKESEYTKLLVQTL